MPVNYDTRNKSRGNLNKTNWQRHIDSCKKKLKKTEINTHSLPITRHVSIQNYFSKKRKIDDTFELGKYCFY